MALLPMLMDLDHLLSTYASGIKAFHSLTFVYLISGSMLAYGYLKGSETARNLGIIGFAVLILSLSMDLLEGGKIAFLYPFSKQAYALPYFGIYQSSKFGIIGVMMFSLVSAYGYELLTPTKSSPNLQG